MSIELISLKERSGKKEKSRFFYGARFDMKTAVLDNDATYSGSISHDSEG